MKRTIGSILILSLIVVLISCGNSTTDTNSLSVESVLTTSSDSTTVTPTVTTFLGTDITNLDELKNTYLEPLTISGIIASNWTDANEIEPDLFLSFYAVATKIFDNTQEEGEIAADKYELFIQKYFDVNRDHLQDTSNYDTKTNTYYIDGLGSSLANVTDAKLDGDTLTLDFEAYALDETTVVRTGKVKLKKEEKNNSFKYISVEVTGK